jgi:hypothetical protein
MAQAMEFAIGAIVSCPMVCCDGMSRMTVDPAARTVTHLVIEPKHRRETHRLVPLHLVDTTAGDASPGHTRLRRGVTAVSAQGSELGRGRHEHTGRGQRVRSADRRHRD